MSWSWGCNQIQIYQCFHYIHINIPNNINPFVKACLIAQPQTISNQSCHVETDVKCLVQYKLTHLLFLVKCNQV